MKTVEMSEATGPLAEYAERAHHETLVVTEGGKPVAVLVPIEEVVEQSRARCHPGAGISTGEMRERLAARRQR